MPAVILIIVLLVLLIILSFRCFHYHKQVNNIRRVIKLMAQGDYSAFASFDQMGGLAHHLNELSSGIQKRLLEMTNEKEKLEAILSSMAEGVLVISPQEKLVHLSPSFLNMFEVRSTQWVEKYYWEIISNPLINESIREAILEKKVSHKEIVMVHPQEMFFDMIISPVIDKKGQLISLVAVFHNVTQLKKYERLRTEFVANVSHELKTPLTSIKGFVETLLNGAVEDKSHAVRFLDIIAKQTTRLENLVNDLLILSSLESKEVKMNFVEADISSVISSVVLMKKEQIHERAQQLSVDIPSGLPLIKMDAQRMEQVFLNLLDNAVKFTPQGGQIKVKAAVEASFLRIDVIDNGKGILAEDVKRIFERFFRSDKSRANETGGTGLGLSIVKHIVDAHHGRIDVDCALGKGCRFSVFLPLAVI